MMNKQKNDKHSNKMHDSQKQCKAPWLGNPDDQEPTNEVKPEEVNP